MRMLKQMRKNSLQEGLENLVDWTADGVGWALDTTAVELHRQLQVSSCQTDTASVSSLADGAAAPLLRLS